MKEKTKIVYLSKPLADGFSNNIVSSLELKPISDAIMPSTFFHWTDIRAKVCKRFNEANSPNTGSMDQFLVDEVLLEVLSEWVLIFPFPMCTCNCLFSTNNELK